MPAQATRRLLNVDPMRPVNYQHPLTRDMEGFWILTEGRQGGSRLYDLSQRGNVGTFREPNGSVSWRVGAEREIYIDYTNTHSDQAGAHIDCGTVPIDGSTGNTVAFWHRTTYDNTSGNDFKNYPFSQAADDGWGVAQDTNNTLFVWTAGGNTQGQGSIQVSDNAWRFVVITWGQPSPLRIMIDGTLDTDDTAYSDSSTDSSAALRWGEAPNETTTASQFEGSLVPVGLWAREVSVSEMEALTDQARRGFPSLLRRRDQSALYVSTAGAVTASVTDTFSLTDTRTTTATASTSRSDTVTVSSSESASLSVAEQLSDTLSLTDAADVAVVFGPSRTDAFTLSESASTSATFSGSVSDALTLSDTASASLSVAGAVADTLGITDTTTATVSGTITASVSDTLTLTDNASVTATFAGALTDLLTLTDTQSGTTSGVIAASVSDTLTLSDTQSASTTLSASVSDAITLDDNLDVVAQAVAEVADTIGLTETVSITLDLSADLSDTLTVSDTVLGSLAGRATTVLVSADTKYEITLSTDGKYQITVTAEPIIESS